MGTKVEPIINGDDCIACWDAGETPQTIWLIFDGIKKGNPPGAIEPPNGRVFVLEQDPLNPCQYLYNVGGPGWQVTFSRRLAPNPWRITLAHATGQYFSGQEPGCPVEHKIYTNILLDPNLFVGYEGVATVHWMEEALNLMEALNLPDDGVTMLEFFLIDEVGFVYKFCNTKYHLNVSIELTP